MASTSEGEVRLTRSQAGKIWDRAFATSWHEIGPDHPSRPALERFVRAGWGGTEVRRFIETGQLDVTVGMPRGAVPVSRYQEGAEGTEEGIRPDPEQAERMHRVAIANPASGQAVAGSY